MLVSVSKLLRLSALVLFSLVIAACSGGGGYGGGSGGKAATVTGGGIKGPMAGAVVNVYAINFNGSSVSQGALVGTGETNAQARITGLSLAFPQTFPYLLVFEADADTTDLTTGQAPVITKLTTVLTSTLAAKGEQVYATPLTNMAVDIAFQNFDDFDGTTSSNEEDLKAALQFAAGQVASTVGFGLDANQIDIFDTPPLVDETVSVGGTDASKTSSANVTAYRAAVEALTAVVSQINDQSTDTQSTPSEVLANLAKDLAGDGEIDGDDGSGNVVVEPTSLDVLDQDPDTLVIPNTGGKTVADIEGIVADETATTGNDVTPAEQQAIKDEQATTQPAARNPDRDGDGVANAKDDYPDNAAADRDTDGDGKPDVAYATSGGVRGAALGDCGASTNKVAVAGFSCSDEDDDNDGVKDSQEATDGTDPLDADSDDDDITDGDEKALGTNPLAADTDDDGVNDKDDNCPVNSNANQTDADQDGRGAACDADDNAAQADADGDGVLDVEDNCPADFNPAQTNSDAGLQGGDALGDVCDDDDDADGVNDSNDAFPRNPNESADNDKDGIGDNEDTDDDNDGSSDSEESARQTDPLDKDSDDDGVLDGADKFPNDATESQDTDGDLTGDNADTDDDNDNVSDADEAQQGTNPRVKDTDRDTVNDDTDNCPVISNGNQDDFDEDDIGDVCDNDDDNDNVLDDADACDNTPADDRPVRANGCGPSEVDTDNDGLTDAQEADRGTDPNKADTDGDGKNDNAEGLTDSDNDGTIDALESANDDADNDGSNAEQDSNEANACIPSESAGTCDRDNDGLTNAEETSAGTNPAVPDSDNDGELDGAEGTGDADGDGTIDALESDEVDTDGDGTNDEVDPANNDVCIPDNTVDDCDRDNDGLTNAEEAELGTDPARADSDGDDIIDGEDDFPLDSDNDGFNNDVDNCPSDANADQANNDQDQQGDVCDDDDDNDNTIDVLDNCPTTANADQNDFDRDQLGDACDDDDDADGVNDDVDACDNTPENDRPVGADGCGATEVDTDDDGLTDAQEAALGTDPNDTDSDDDGETDGDEGTSDSDNDGTPDALESDEIDDDNDGTNNEADGNNTDPCVPSNVVGICDADNDGLTNDEEQTAGTNPTEADTDGDGVNDGDDAKPLDNDNDGVNDNADDCDATPAGADVDANGCAETQLDADNDGVSDAVDVCADTPEGETPNSAGCAPSQIDTDEDGVPDVDDNCPADANTNQLDTDGDEDGDACDTDDDGDGVADASDNCPGTTAAQRANVDADGCHADQLTSMLIDGDFNTVSTGISEAGPGDSDFTDDLFSGIEFDVEEFDFTISGLTLSGTDEGGQGLFLHRNTNDAGMSGFSYGDCISDPGDCTFTETLVRKDDVLFITGFVDTEIGRRGSDETRYTVEASPRLSMLPIENNGTAQALVLTEFAVADSFETTDADSDGSADPDLNDDEYESELEATPGVVRRSAFGLLNLAVRKPAAQHTQASLAGSYGYVSLVQYSSQVDAAVTYQSVVEPLRADLVVAENGNVSGAFVATTGIKTEGNGSFSEQVVEAETLLSGSSLSPATDVGETTLTLVFPDDIEDDDTLVLNGAMSADASVGAFQFFESNGVEGVSDPTDGEVEFGVLLRRLAVAPSVANTTFRLNMIGREFGQQYDSINFLAQNIKLNIGAAASSCDTELGVSTLCFDATLSGVDGLHFQEARHAADTSNNRFGELAADGSNSDGDFVLGQAFSEAAKVKVSNDGQVIIEILDTDVTPSVPEDIFRGYIGVNGAIAFVGGSADTNYGNSWLGLGVQVSGSEANAALDNHAPVITSVAPTSAADTFPIAPSSSISLSATVTDNENDSITYKWVARAGTLSQTDAQSVSWTAPSNSSGSTILEVHVSDGLSTVVGIIEVSWGLAQPTADQKTAALLVMDEALESPAESIDWLLFVVPDSDDLPTCENAAGTVTRTFTDNNETSDPFDPGLGDVVTVTFNNCIEGYNSFDDEFYGVNAGEFKMTITQADNDGFDWRVDITNLEFVDGECDGSVDGNCVIKEKEVDNGIYLVENTTIDTPADFDSTAPADTTVQFDTYITFTSYTSLEQELDDAGTAFEDIANFSLKTADNPAVYITEYADDSDSTLAYRLDLFDFGFTGTEIGETNPAIDLDIDTGSGGLMQAFSDASGFQHMSGEQSIIVNALSFVEISEGWLVNINAIGSTSTTDFDQAYDVTVDTDDDAAADFGFAATQEDVWNSDECDLAQHSSSTDCAD